MKEYGLAKKGYFSLTIITIITSYIKLQIVDIVSRLIHLVYENQERKTSPPFLNIFWI